jgi:hypothetical protein
MDNSDQPFDSKQSDNIVDAFFILIEKRQQLESEYYLKPSRKLKMEIMSLKVRILKIKELIVRENN